MTLLFFFRSWPNNADVSDGDGPSRRQELPEYPKRKTKEEKLAAKRLAFEIAALEHQKLTKKRRKRKEEELLLLFMHDFEDGDYAH